MSDSESRCTSPENSDSEGSLVDFIVHDEDVIDDDEDEFSAEEEEEFSAEEKEEEEAEAEEKEEEKGVEAEAEAEVEMEVECTGDSMVASQYNQSMENEGLVTTATGVRRSMRKSKAPVRYVDEDYVGLMVEDVDSNAEWSSSDGDDDSE